MKTFECNLITDSAKTLGCAAALQGGIIIGKLVLGLLINNGDGRSR